jgi:quercetin dioxygenase-like cupin family protein
MIIADFIDMTDTMYPSFAVKKTDGVYKTGDTCTVYGYVHEGQVNFEDGSFATKGQYFSKWFLRSGQIDVTGTTMIFVRIGYKGQNIIGGPLEESGRLCYIDGCSDSLLIYPPRQGDPSLNALFFPQGIEQSFHIHPSIRLGVVAKGHGFSCIQTTYGEKRIELKEGDLFCIEERELHRFVTTHQSGMVVVPYHPDGDWGPTDHNHTMLNRTYIK